MAVEPLADVAHGGFHPFYPLPGQAVSSPGIKEGNDFPLQKIVKGLSLHLVLKIRVLVLLTPADGPAAFRPVGFIPPAVQDGEIQDPVDGRLHAAGSAGLQGAPRRVQPEVASRDQVAGHGHVVVFQKDDLAAYPGITGEMDDLFYDLLPFYIMGMGFAGKYQLNWALIVRKQPDQSVRILQEGVCPFIGGKTPGKADGKGIGRQGAFGRLNLRLRLAPPLELSLQTGPGKGYQALPAALVGPEKLFIGDPLDSVPDIQIGRLVKKTGPEIAIQKIDHIMGKPGPGMHTVGDMDNGNLIPGKLGPDVVPHGARNISMQLADPVRIGG